MGAYAGRGTGGDIVTDPTRAGGAVNAGRLWAGGVAAALVAALIAVVGILHNSRDPRSWQERDH